MRVGFPVVCGVFAFRERVLRVFGYRSLERAAACAFACVVAYWRPAADVNGRVATAALSVAETVDRTASGAHVRCKGRRRRRQRRAAPAELVGPSMHCALRSNTAIIPWKTPPPTLRPPPSAPTNPRHRHRHFEPLVPVTTPPPPFHRRQLSSPKTHISTEREKPNL